MAQGDGVFYNDFYEKVLSGGHNLDSGGNTFKLAILNAYTPNVDTHDEFGDVVASEASGAGYTAGGKAMTGLDVVQDDTNNRATVAASTLTWTGLNVGVANAYLVMYNDTASGDPLVAYWENTVPTNGGDYSVSWAGGFVMTLAQAA